MDNIPGVKKSWEQITIAEHFLIDEIDNSTCSVIEKRIKILSVLTEMPESNFMDVNSEELANFFDNELSFLKTEPKASLKDYYFINGRKYKLIKEYSQLSAGQFLDIEKYTEDQSIILDQMHWILSVVLIPVKELTPSQVVNNLFYKAFTRSKLLKRIADRLNWRHQEGILEKYMDTSPAKTAEEIYNHMMITDAKAILVFFCLVASLFSVTTQIYLMQTANDQLKSALKTLKQEDRNQMTVQKIQEAMDFIENGDGLL